MRIAPLVLCLLPLLLAPARAPAEERTAPPPKGTLIRLEAQASREVPNDLMRVSFFVELEDADPARLAAAVNEKANAALALARAAKGLRVQSAGYHSWPVQEKGRILRWRARSAFFVEGRDFKALAELTGRLQAATQVGGMSFSLSPEARVSAEEALIDEAVAAFRRRAALAARSAGGGDYRIQELALDGDGGRPPRPLARMALAAEAVPAPDVEGGVTQLTLRASGAIETAAPVK